MAKSKKASSTEMTKWDAVFAEAAKQQVETVADIGGGNFIGTASGRLKLDGAFVPNNKMNVVIVHQMRENNWYTGKYDPNNPENPACFAYGRGKGVEEMKPEPESPDPQSDDCASCDKNEYGSADNEKGKACANRIRLAVLPANLLDKAEKITKAEMKYIKVTPTSLKTWAGYARDLEENFHKHIAQVVTEIGLEPSSDHQFDFTFKMVEVIEDGAAMAAIGARFEKEKKAIQFPYVQISNAKKGKAKSDKPKKARKF